MVAVKKVTMNHRSHLWLAQLGTVRKRSKDRGHMNNHFTLFQMPPEDEKTAVLRLHYSSSPNVICVSRLTPGQTWNCKRQQRSCLLLYFLVVLVFSLIF